MPPPLHRIPKLRRGDTFVLPLEIVDADTEAPIDITGRRYSWSGKRSIDLTDQEATGENGWYLSVVASGEEAVQGRIALRVAPAQTDLLVGDYVTDAIETIDGESDYERIVVPSTTISVYLSATRGAQ